MASPTDIHNAIAGRLAAVDGLAGFAYPPQGIAPPFAYVTLGEWTVSTFSRIPVRDLAFEVRLFTAQTARPQDGHRAGTFSGTLDGVTYSLARTMAMVTGFRTLGAQEIDEFQMYGGVFTVT